MSKACVYRKGRSKDRDAVINGWSMIIGTKMARIYAQRLWCKVIVIKNK